MKWTIEDFQNDLCALSDVGRDKPPPTESAQEAEAVPVELPLTDTLEADIRHTYHELGGRDYLKRNPALLNKMLLRQAPAATERRVITLEDRKAILERMNEARREMPWVSPKRLSYERHRVLGDDIAVSEGAELAGYLPPFYRCDEEGNEIDLNTLTDAPPEPPPAEPAAEPSPGPAQHAADPAPIDPTPTPETRAAGRISKAPEREDSRQHWGPRGNAKHR